MIVTYSDDKKYAYFNGETFTRDERTGYYLTTQNHLHHGRRLHRAVWEYYNCTVPEGYHVHHIDHDKSNNDISNLQLMAAEEHRKIHGIELTEVEISWRRKNLMDNAVPKAAEWHGSEAGVQWHKRQYERTKEKLHEKLEFVCEECGKSFTAVSNGQNRFCSNSCKSANRRKSGKNSIVRVCAICGVEFSTDKYKKTVCCSPKCAATMRYKRHE